MKNRFFLKTVMILGVAFFVTTAFAQDCADFTAYPGGENEGKKVHVLYRDLVDKENYDEAFPMWESLMENSPGGHVYHFIDGITMYNAMIEKENGNEVPDDTKVAEYTQKIVDLYEQRLACMSPERGDSNTVIETMAYELAALGYEDTDKTLATFQKAVAMNGNKTSAYILAYYADHVIFLFGNDMLDKETTRNVYLELEAIKDANADDEDYATNWEYVEEYYAPFEPYVFDGDYFLKKLKPTYEADANNPEVYRPILVTLLQKGCSKNDPFIRELIVKDSLYILEENKRLGEKDKLENPDYYGIRLMKAGDESGAIPYLKTAAAKTDLDSDRRANANYYLARIYHKKGGSSNFSTARNYYEAAAKLKTGWGEPYYQIGVLYASSGPLCGPGTGWDSQIVLWPAIDMWNKAINSGDAEAAAQAKQKINHYTQYLPTKEDAFQRGIKQGSGVRVGCWIQRSSTARLRSQY